MNLEEKVSSELFAKLFSRFGFFLRPFELNEAEKREKHAIRDDLMELNQIVICENPVDSNLTQSMWRRLVWTKEEAEEFQRWAVDYIQGKLKISKRTAVMSVNWFMLQYSPLVRGE